MKYVFISKAIPKEATLLGTLRERCTINYEGFIL